MAEQIAALSDLLIRVQRADAWMKANPGVVKALGKVLAVLSRVFPWAVDLKALLDDAPGVLATAEDHLPQVIFVLKETAPVGGGIVGDRR